MVGMSYRDPTTKELIKIPTGCAGGGSPVGTVVPYVGSTAPVGWVIADGRAHNSPALESLLGSANTPDLRGRFILAASSTHAAKTSGGEETHTLTVAEIPAHDHAGATAAQNANHTHSATSATESADHVHGIPISINPGGVMAGSSDGYHISSLAMDRNTGGISANHTHGVTTGGESANHAHGLTAQGGGGAHNNMPPFYALMYIIKAWSESAIGGITLPDADARYVKKSGDTMTGKLGFQDTAGRSAYLRSVDYENGPLMQVVNEDASTLLAISVSTPTNNAHAATKGYVDGAFVGYPGTLMDNWATMADPWVPGLIKAGQMVLGVGLIGWQGPDYTVPANTFAQIGTVNPEYRPVRSMMCNGRMYSPAGGGEQSVRLDVRTDGTWGIFGPAGGFPLTTNAWVSLAACVWSTK